MFAYNPSYKKGESKVPDTLSIEELEVAAEIVAKDLGIEEFEVLKSTPEDYVEFKTWFVYAKSHTESDRVKLAGPFGTKAAAEDRLKELDSKKITDGDLDDKKLSSLKFRVNGRLGSGGLDVSYEFSRIGNKEFTRVFSQNYDRKKLLDEKRGKITGKKFGI